VVILVGIREKYDRTGSVGTAVIAESAAPGGW
jgi:hypothetical protein